MKQKKLFLLVTLFLSISFLSSCSSDDETIRIINFNKQLTASESEFKTDKGVKDEENSWPNYTLYHYTFKSQKNELEFTHSYTPESGFAGGFTYTNKTDITTSGYTNLSAITGKGKLGDTYLTASVGQPTKITINNPDKYSFNEMWITNATYAYLAIKEGYGVATQFKEGDWFKVIITGYDSENKKMGNIDFYLADYRNGKTDILKEWMRIDLGSLREANYLVFSMDSSDKGDWGINTPTYFCADAISLIEK